MHSKKKKNTQNNETHYCLDIHNCILDQYHEEGDHIINRIVTDDEHGSITSNCDQISRLGMDTHDIHYQEEVQAPIDSKELNTLV